MPSNTVINEKVRNTLDSKRKVLGRVNLDSDPYKSASKNKKSYLIFDSSLNTADLENIIYNKVLSELKK